MFEAFQLGASLYVPALHPKLDEVLAHRAYPQLKSVIVCTEDAVAKQDVAQALIQLRQSLGVMPCTPNLLRFVRVRNPDVMREVLTMPGCEHLSGFVLPKITVQTLDAYKPHLWGSWALMPTLETLEVFNMQAMQALRAELLQPRLRERIVALRIGGNDLLRELGMRRPRGVTLYETPLGALLGQLMLTFKPYGFALTAPVFDILDDDALLRSEVRRDLAFGFCGKTAVHPAQVSIIEGVFKVNAVELAAAKKILASNCPAVFRMGGAMHEVAVHGPWAQRVFSRAQHYGVEAIVEGSRSVSSIENT